MTGQGVCRDYAHVVIALLRAMDMPARYAACFAPGLRPMDFHAVAEAYYDGAWYVIDATRLANRRSLVRIATGRDASDCAFLSYHGGHVGLARMRVDAWVVPDDASLESLDGDAGAAAVGRGIRSRPPTISRRSSSSPELPRRSSAATVGRVRGTRRGAARRLDGL